MTDNIIKSSSKGKSVQFWKLQTFELFQEALYSTLQRIQQHSYLFGSQNQRIFNGIVFKRVYSIYKIQDNFHYIILLQSDQNTTESGHQEMKQLLLQCGSQERLEAVLNSLSTKNSCQNTKQKKEGLKILCTVVDIHKDKLLKSWEQFLKVIHCKIMDEDTSTYSTLAETVKNIVKKIFYLEVEDTYDKVNGQSRINLKSSLSATNRNNQEEDQKINKIKGMNNNQENTPQTIFQQAFSRRNHFSSLKKQNEIEMGKNKNELQIPISSQQNRQSSQSPTNRQLLIGQMTNKLNELIALYFRIICSTYNQQPIWTKRQICAATCLSLTIQSADTQIVNEIRKDTCNRIINFLTEFNSNADTQLLDCILNLAISQEQQFGDCSLDVIQFTVGYLQADIFTQEQSQQQSPQSKYEQRLINPSKTDAMLNYNWQRRKILIDLIYTLSVLTPQVIPSFKGQAVKLLQHLLNDRTLQVKNAAQLALQSLSDINRNDIQRVQILPPLTRFSNYQSMNKKSPSRSASPDTERKNKSSTSPSFTQAPCYQIAINQKTGREAPQSMLSQSRRELLPGLRKLSPSLSKVVQEVDLMRRKRERKQQKGLGSGISPEFLKNAPKSEIEFVSKKRQPFKQLSFEQNGRNNSQSQKRNSQSPETKDLLEIEKKIQRISTELSECQTLLKGKSSPNHHQQSLQQPIPQEGESAKLPYFQNQSMNFSQSPERRGILNNQQQQLNRSHYDQRQINDVDSPIQPRILQLHSPPDQLNQIPLFQQSTFSPSKNRVRASPKTTQFSPSDEEKKLRLRKPHQKIFDQSPQTMATSKNDSFDARKSPNSLSPPNRKKIFSQNIEKPPANINEKSASVTSFYPKSNKNESPLSLFNTKKQIIEENKQDLSQQENLMLLYQNEQKEDQIKHCLKLIENLKKQNQQLVDCNMQLKQEISDSKEEMFRHNESIHNLNQTINQLKQENKFIGTKFRDTQQIMAQEQDQKDKMFNSQLGQVNSAVAGLLQQVQQEREEKINVLDQLQKTQQEYDSFKIEMKYVVNRLEKQLHEIKKQQKLQKIISQNNNDSFRQVDSQGYAYNTFPNDKDFDDDDNNQDDENNQQFEDDYDYGHTSKSTKDNSNATSNYQQTLRQRNDVNNNNILMTYNRNELQNNNNSNNINHLTLDKNKTYFKNNPIIETKINDENEYSLIVNQISQSSQNTQRKDNSSALSNRSMNNYIPDQNTANQPYLPNKNNSKQNEFFSFRNNNHQNFHFPDIHPALTSLNKSQNSILNTKEGNKHEKVTTLRNISKSPSNSRSQSPRINIPSSNDYQKKESQEFPATQTKSTSSLLKMNPNQRRYLNDSGENPLEHGSKEDSLEKNSQDRFRKLPLDGGLNFKNNAGNSNQNIFFYETADSQQIQSKQQQQQSKQSSQYSPQKQSNQSRKEDQDITDTQKIILSHIKAEHYNEAMSFALTDQNRETIPKTLRYLDKKKCISSLDSTRNEFLLTKLKGMLFNKEEIELCVEWIQYILQNRKDISKLLLTSLRDTIDIMLNQTKSTLQTVYSISDYVLGQMQNILNLLLKM